MKTLPAAIPTPRMQLDEQIKQHRVEVERLRAELGDPDQALTDFVLQRFDSRVLEMSESETESPDRHAWDIDDSDGW